MALITVKPTNRQDHNWAGMAKTGRLAMPLCGISDKRTLLPGSVLAAVLVFACSASETFAGTFRWIDGQGNVHYTDQVPPEESKRPHAKLNTEAQTIELIEGQKTQEELEQAKRLGQLRQDQQRILAQQKDSDLSLLRTYRSLEEMQMALQNKVNTMDSTIKISDSNRLHQEENLRSQVGRAAEIELAGQPIPKNLRDSIDSTRRQIAIYQDKIRMLQHSKEEIIKEFDKDLERFKNLENLRQHPEYGTLEWHPQSSNSDVGVLSMFICKPTVCGLAWTLAKDYVKSKTSQVLVTETETILQTASPRDDKDMALLLVRIPGKTSDTLFLDTSCHTSSLGDEYCTSAAAKQIRAGFAPFIEQSLIMGGR